MSPFVTLSHDRAKKKARAMGTPVVHSSKGDWAVLDLESEHPWVPRVYLPAACGPRRSHLFSRRCRGSWTLGVPNEDMQFLCFRREGHTGRHTSVCTTQNGRVRVVAVWGDW